MRTKDYLKYTLAAAAIAGFSGIAANSAFADPSTTITDTGVSPSVSSHAHAKLTSQLTIKETATLNFKTITRKASGAVVVTVNTDGIPSGDTANQSGTPVVGTYTVGGSANAYSVSATLGSCTSGSGATLTAMITRDASKIVATEVTGAPTSITIGSPAVVLVGGTLSVAAIGTDGAITCDVTISASF